MASRQNKAYSVADLDLELRKKSGFDSFALLAFLPAVVNFSFFTQNKEGSPPPGPSPRYATATQALAGVAGVLPYKKPASHQWVEKLADSWETGPEDVQSTCQTEFPSLQCG